MWNSVILAQGLRHRGSRCYLPTYTRFLYYLKHKIAGDKIFAATNILHPVTLLTHYKY